MTIATLQPSTRIPIVRMLLCLCLLLIPVASVHAQSERTPARPNGPGTGIPDDDLVPWRFAEKGEAIEKAPLTVYWLPTSQKEVERSPLLMSKSLLKDSLRCVSFKIVLPENTKTTELLSATGTLPSALLVNREGVVIRRIVNARAALPPTQVEELVHTELAARDEAMYHAMSEARKHAVAGEKEAAITLYRSVWNDRCFFPMAGLEAQRALKTLGVEVKDTPAPIAVDPQLKKPLTVKPQ